MKRVLFSTLNFLGTAGRAVIALLGIGVVVAGAANYTMTQGVGTTFGSLVVGGVNYTQQFVCDLVTPGQCVNVKAASTAPVAADEALVVTESPNSALIANGATTAHTCSVAAYGVLGCLGQIDDDVKASIAAGTNLIGKVGIDQTTPGATNAVQANVASGGIASGAIASGAVASGALASGAVASGAIASGAVASGAIASGAFAAGSFINATAGDPCMFQPKTNAAISTASGTTAIVTGVSAKKIYVCSLLIISPSSVSVSLAEGSSNSCGTSNQAAVVGVATNGTAANGVPLAANTGWTFGNGGGTVAATATATNYLCIFQSGTAQLAGNITYVQQ